MTEEAMSTTHWPDPRDVLTALAGELRASAECSIRRDQAWKARYLAEHPAMSERVKGVLVRHGHGNAALLSIARQIERRCERWTDL